MTTTMLTYKPPSSAPAEVVAQRPLPVHGIASLDRGAICVALAGVYREWQQRYIPLQNAYGYVYGDKTNNKGFMSRTNSM